MSTMPSIGARIFGVTQLHGRLFLLRRGSLGLPGNGFDARLRGIVSRARLIVGLLGLNVLMVQGFLAFEGQARVFQIGLRLRHLRSRLLLVLGVKRHVRLLFLRLNDGQQFTVRDHVAFFDEQFLQTPLNLRAHNHLVRGDDAGQDNPVRVAGRGVPCDDDSQNNQENDDNEFAPVHIAGKRGAMNTL